MMDDLPGERVLGDKSVETTARRLANYGANEIAECERIDR